MSSRIDPNYTAFISLSIKPDAEWQQIIELLSRKYGVRSSGSKSMDRQKLHELELKDAQKESVITNKFLTVTKAEQEKIQENKKEKKAENQTHKNNDSQQGAQILGEQVYIAIMLNQEKQQKVNKKKRENNHES